MAKNWFKSNFSGKMAIFIFLKDGSTTRVPQIMLKLSFCRMSTFREIANTYNDELSQIVCYLEADPLDEMSVSNDQFIFLHTISKKDVSIQYSPKNDISTQTDFESDPEDFDEIIQNSPLPLHGPNISSQPGKISFDFYFDRKMVFKSSKISKYGIL